MEGIPINGVHIELHLGSYGTHNLYHIPPVVFECKDKICWPNISYPSVVGNLQYVGCDKTSRIYYAMWYNYSYAAGITVITSGIIA